MQCLKCLRGFHDICDAGSCRTCHTDTVESTQTVLSYRPPDETDNESEDADSLRTGGLESDFEDDDDNGVGGLETSAKDAMLRDQQSTGRKRAAKLYPLNRNAPCEWRGIPQPGGSATPIEDCVDGLQQAIHHGPDYSTLNNDPGNVHRICHRHHNRWHTVNDPLKGEAYLALYGHKVKDEDLSTAAKEHRSGKRKTPREQLEAIVKELQNGEGKA